MPPYINAELQEFGSFKIRTLSVWPLLNNFIVYSLFVLPPAGES